MPVSGVAFDELLTEAWGDSVSASIAALEAAEATTYKPGGTDVAVADGGTGASTQASARSNLGLGTAAVPAFNGITFPAVDVPNAGVNVLDDYDEGVFSPSLEFVTPGTAVFTPVTAAGFYTKIGNRVLFHGFYQATLNAYTGASGGLRMQGFPFAASAVAASGARFTTLIQGYTKAGYTQVVGSMTAGATNATFRAQGSGVATAALLAADIPPGAPTATIILEFAGQYMV